MEKGTARWAPKDNQGRVHQVLKGGTGAQQRTGLERARCTRIPDHGSSGPARPEGTAGGRLDQGTGPLFYRKCRAVGQATSVP